MQVVPNRIGYVELVLQLVQLLTVTEQVRQTELQETQRELIKNKAGSLQERQDVVDVQVLQLFMHVKQIELNVSG